MSNGKHSSDPDFIWIGTKVPGGPKCLVLGDDMVLPGEPLPLEKLNSDTIKDFLKRGWIEDPVEALAKKQQQAAVRAKARKAAAAKVAAAKNGKKS
jgi:hypothetical protein